MSEITNPYRPGEPVADPAMLFGRQDAADWLELQLGGSARALVLSSQPLIGKTSFIKYVGGLQHLNTYNLLVNLPDPAAFPQAAPPAKGRRAEPSPGRAVLDAILQQVVEQLVPQLAQLKLVASLSPAEDATPVTAVLQNLFSQANRQVGQAKLVLYLDNLHRLVTDDLALVATFLSAFIPLLDTCPALHLVFTSNQDKLKQIRHPLLDGAPTFQLTTLSADASATMITQPVRNILRFDYGIPRRIAEVNSHHPYYLCLFCHTLLNRQIHDGWVNQRDFDSAMGEMLASPIEPFEQIWEQSSWVERAVLSGMAAMQGKHGPMTQQEITRFLQREEETVAQDVVIDALQSLAARGILAPMGAVSYRFYVELLRYWLHEHTDYTEIIKQVDWNKLAAQQAKEKKQSAAPAYTPPATTAPQPSSRQRFFWRALILLAALLCLCSLCGVFGGQYFGFDLPAFLSTPAATPMATPGNPAALAGSESTESTATAAPAEPTPTVTPTPALVVARTLPSITYMGRDIDQNWRIYVMNADGSNVTTLSPAGFDDTAPTWSPDGRRLAFVSQRDGNREIYVMDTTCDNPDGCSQDAINVTRHAADDWTPAWSSEGNQLAFSSLREGSWEIFVLDTACLSAPETCPDNLRQITSDGNLNISPVWSPDGSRFAFTSKASGNWDVYTMATDGTGIRQITTAPGNDLSPAWSPDGSRIAYEANQEGNVEIYVIDANGTTVPQNISNYASANDHGPTWSPDGQMLVFYSNRATMQWDIFSTTLDGQVVNNLTQTPNRDEQTPAWRP